MKGKGLIAAVSIMTMLTSGCASMFHGTNETIQVRSEEPDTKFFAGTREIGKGTVAITAIPKSELSSVVLRAEKKGCSTKSSNIQTSFDATSLLGILIDWGIISILVVDWGINGAVNRAAQTDFMLTPDCAVPASAAVKSAI